MRAERRRSGTSSDAVRAGLKIERTLWTAKKLKTVVATNASATSRVRDAMRGNRLVAAALDLLRSSRHLGELV